MEKWIQLSSAIYYTGVGAVLLGTTIRFLFNFIENYNDNQKFLTEIRDVHLQNIYNSLTTIAKHLNIDIDLESPRL